MSEFLEVRCGMHRFLVPSADVSSIEVLDGALEPFNGRRAPRDLMLLDGRVLAGSNATEALERGVALRAVDRDRVEARIVVDQVGALIRCESGDISPLPRAVAFLQPFFSGVWRDHNAGEFLFCVRPCGELPQASFTWRRLLRRAALAARPDAEQKLARRQGAMP